MQDIIILQVPVSDLTTVIEAAEHLGVHFSSVYRWLSGKSKPPVDIPIHPITIAGQVYLIKGEVECMKAAIDESKGVNKNANRAP